MNQKKLCNGLRNTFFSLVCALIGLSMAMMTPQANAAPPQKGGDVFKVTLLGTGTPAPRPDRFGPSTLVEVGGKKLLFDCGRGATIRLRQLRISLGAIDAHFLTHLHSDHINGLTDIYAMGYLRKPLGGRTSPFVIYGPAGTKSLMEGVSMVTAEDRRIRSADERLNADGMKIEAHDMPLGKVYDKDGIVVTAYESDHGKLIKPTCAYKVTYGGHSVVIAGDSKYSEGVKEAATGADLLIHSVCLLPDPLKEKFKRVYEHHISPEKAGELFAAAKPKLAVFHHFVLIGLPHKGIPSMTADDVVAATRAVYDGPVMAGVDLMGFKIDDSGVSVLEPKSKPDFKKKGGKK